jgi:hypothetical protein
MEDPASVPTPQAVSETRWPLVLSIAILVAIQCAISLPRLRVPLIDSRLHTTFDTAAFLRTALHSNDPTLEDWRKVFGVSVYEYDEQDTPVSVLHYSHHGVLSPMLLRWYAKLVGYSELTTRSYSLILSLGSTVLLFVLLGKATQNHPLAFGLTLLNVLLPLKYVYMDVWKYEGMVEFLLLACYLCFVQRHRHRYWRYAFLAVVFLILHADYPAYLPLAFVLFDLFLNRRQPGERRLLVQGAVAAGLGLITTLLIQSSLGLTAAAMRTNVGFRLGGGMETASLAQFAERYLSYMLANLGLFHVIVMVTALLFLVTSPSFLRNPFVYLGSTLICSTLVYTWTFRNATFIHHYLLWNYGNGYSLLMGGLLGEGAASRWLKACRTPVLLLLLLPSVLTTWQLAIERQANFTQTTFGTKEDIELIRSMEKRILYFDNGLSGPTGWWHSPGITLYTDPIFRGGRRARARNIMQLKQFHPDRDVVVMMRGEQVYPRFAAALKETFGIETLRSYLLSPSFVYFTFELPS